MTRKDEYIANFWKRLINTQNSDKSEGGDAKNIPSEEIAKLNKKITDAFNKGDIDAIIAVTKDIFNFQYDETTIKNFERYLTQNKGGSSFPNLLKEYEKFLRNTISQNKKEQNISFFSGNDFACVGGTITRLELYNNSPFIEMIISLLEPNAASFVSNGNQIHIRAFLHFLAGFNTEDVHKFAPATDPSMTKEVMEEICKLTNPAALLDRIARKIADELLELDKSVKNEEEIVRIINDSNVKRYIDILIEAIQKAYPNLKKEDKELNLYEALQSPQLYLLRKENYLPFSMVDKEDTDDGVKKKEIKTEIIKGINKIIHKAEGEKNGENEINQYITEEQKAKFEQIGKLFL
ncbi:MAG: hypothetical protein ACO3R7_05955, partial [Flavobacteriaceae bacterium]